MSKNNSKKMIIGMVVGIIAIITAIGRLGLVQGTQSAVVKQTAKQSVENKTDILANTKAVIEFRKDIAYINDGIKRIEETQTKILDKLP